MSLPTDKLEGQVPSMFSKDNPKLQLAWDATSLNALMFCPRRYQYTILEGWTGEKNDLEFGILVHASMDVFGRARLANASVADATALAVRYAVEASGSYDANGGWHPWGGRYENEWRCEGAVPYLNAKGNKAKCPFSHKGKWFPTPAPSVCQACGSTTEVQRHWLGRDPRKDRPALIRLVAWYCEEQKETADEGVVGYAFPDGTPAVELPFRIPLPYTTKTGENYILAGYLDSVKLFGDEAFIGDYKTTKKNLNQGFFGGFAPSGQMDTYDIAGTILFPDLDLKGVMIEGLQCLPDGAKFGRGLIYHSEEYREEWLREMGMWLELAEHYAEQDYWPMARANCWLCEFKQICAMSPLSRARYLPQEFDKRHWNPLNDR